MKELAEALGVNRQTIYPPAPGGRVDVTFETIDGTPGRVRTLVTDTGAGIAAQNLEKLFEPFERLGAERRAIDGTGLGLTLSKGLIEAIGGAIAASSTPGVGSTFTIELSRVPAPGGKHPPMNPHSPGSSGRRLVMRNPG